MTHCFPSEQPAIVETVKREGYADILRWLAELTDEERERFLEQLATLDFPHVRELAALIGAPAEGVELGGIEPPTVQRLPRTDAEAMQEAAACEVGRSALRDGRVAALTVAGGQGTRLCWEGPKGLFPITPVRQHTLFQVLAEGILAARRRHGCRMPWLIMTSPDNDAETRAFLEQKGHFGLGGDTVHFFAQQTNPILTDAGGLLLEAKGRLLVGPDGHGGVFDGLARSHLLDELESCGVELICYFQVDNPLVSVADERFIGHHVRLGAEFSCKVVAKRDPSEKLGVAALQRGRPAIVEYSDLPDALARASTPSGELKYLFGSIAVHIISTSLARRMSEKNTALPWHVARKQYDVIGEGGRMEEVTCFKFERFVFDALARAAGCAFVDVDRGSEFAPVKNAEGEDSPETARAMMRAMWVSWLREAGVDVACLDDPAAEIEISPLFASNAAELKSRLPVGWAPEPPVVLE
ncbi:MAG: UTP--glucose-1-phosphate uridylyltransferase [Candidatus Brocadiia bacterium]|jgi:UDP-N-acetylglucosamine/UDP-N-acetylgalactosamine diphosphorylase|nr:UTP--glucose-1-phosphate uridylyltransferase [Candidatus Brocadiia bacterium]